MRLVHALGAAVAATTLVASVAKATLTMSLVPVPTAVANARSFDLKVTQSGGEKWNVTTLQATLGTTGGLSGSFYTPAGHSNINFPASPPSDTSFTTPRFAESGDISHIDILGTSDYPANLGLGTVPTVGPTSLNIAWGDHNASDPGTTGAAGTYTVTHLTVVGNTGGFLSGYSAGTSGNTAQVFSNLYLPILGDTDANHTVDLQDLFNVQNNFGLNASGDANSDGTTDLSDLFAVQNQFGNTLAGPGAALGSLVPEPASMSAILLGSLSVVARRRRITR